MLFFAGLPETLAGDQLGANLAGARGAHSDESSRTRAGFGSSTDPAFQSSGSSAGSKLEERDVASLRKKFKFLEDFSDSYIRNTPYEALLRTETTAIKIGEFERNKAVTLRLSHNRDSLSTSFSSVSPGRDNHWDELHEARFLPGAGCTAAKLWLKARETFGDSSPLPISTYDMNRIGLGGYVSKRGWVEIHDVGKDSLSLKLFNINGCGNKILANKQEEEFKDILELGEFKLALRVAREALSFVHPWNKSISAIEGFLIQTNYVLRGGSVRDRETGSHLDTVCGLHLRGERGQVESPRTISQYWGSQGSLGIFLRCQASQQYPLVQAGWTGGKAEYRFCPSGHQFRQVRFLQVSG